MLPKTRNQLLEMARHLTYLAFLALCALAAYALLWLAEIRWSAMRCGIKTH
jgi:hypothetical protein